VSKVCERCGKGPQVVNAVTRRGKAKAQGGVGRKVTGVHRTRQLPNLQRVRLRQGGAVLKVKLCARCLRDLQRT
jgi:large subunit ribosomal protein L28